MTAQNDLRTLRAGAPLADGDRLAPQRAALLTAIREDDGSGPAPVRPPFPRRGLMVGTAAAAAFAVAGGVVVSLPGHSGGGADGGPRVLSAQESARALELAAATVAEYGSPEPGPKQWVYEKSKRTEKGLLSPTTEQWTRWDGTGWASRGGAAYPNSDPHKLHVTYTPNMEAKWKKEGYDDRSQRQYYDFLATLPSDPDRLLAAIRREHAIGDIPGETRAQRDWREIDVLYRSVLLPPNAQAALFRALARIPGARVEKGVKDPAGRRAIGVAVNYARPTASGQVGKQEIWFDATTYAYLGEVMHAAPIGTPHGSTDRLTSGSPAAITEVRLDWGVVDEPGQLP